MIFFTDFFINLHSRCPYLQCFGFVLVFCLTSRSTIFQSFCDGATCSWVFTSTLGAFKGLAQKHYTAVVGFEPLTSCSGVRSSTTVPPRLPYLKCELMLWIIQQLMSPLALHLSVSLLSFEELPHFILSYFLTINT